MKINVVASRPFADLDDWVDQHPWWALALILLLALTVNTAKLVAEPPTLATGDAQQWWDIALNVSQGHGYSGCVSGYFPFCGATNQVTAAREPVPVLLIALVASLTHQSVVAVSLAQLAINLLILAGIFCLTREVADVRVALLAALLWAFYVPAIRAVLEIGGDLLGTLGVTWGLFFFIRGLRTQHLRDWLAAAVCIGLGALSRSAILFIAPALMVGWILWQRPTLHPMRSLIASARAPLLFALVVSITLLPWEARNYAAFGRPVIGTTLVGFNLFRYNNIVSTESYLHYVGPSEANKAVQALLASRADLRGTENEVQMDIVYRDAAVRIIAANPVHYAFLSGYRFLMLWFDWRVPEAYGSATSA